MWIERFIINDWKEQKHGSSFSNRAESLNSSCVGNNYQVQVSDSFKEIVLESIMERASEKLGVSVLGVFERAALGDTTRDARGAWQQWWRDGTVALWALNYCRKVLETRQDTLMRVEE